MGTITEKGKREKVKNEIITLASKFDSAFKKNLPQEKIVYLREILMKKIQEFNINQGHIHEWILKPREQGTPEQKRTHMEFFTIAMTIGQKQM